MEYGHESLEYVHHIQNSELDYGDLIPNRKIFRTALLLSYGVSFGRCICARAIGQVHFPIAVDVSKIGFPDGNF